MTGFERVKAVFKRQQPDRVPFYPIVSGLAAGLVGIDTKTYYTEFDKFADAHIALYGEIKHDIVALMADLYMEVQAMGAKVEFPDGDLPRLRSYLLEDKAALDTLKVPEPSNDERMPAYLEACTKVSKAVTESPVGGVICGPWTIATDLRGAENLIMDTATDPAFVHELMRFCVEIPKRFGEAVRQAGAGLSLSEAPASLSLISPKIYREFVLPYQKDVISHLREKRISVTLHICGFIDPIMEDIASTGAIAISMDRPSSLEKMFEASAGRIVVIGNVPTGVFLDGTREEMEDEVKRCMAVGKEKGGFILSSGCELSPRGDFEKVKWFCELASKYGRLN
jgi:MtaA/CmuA family methyltransferase